MTLWLRVAVPCLYLIAVCTMALAQPPEGWDRYLDRYRGPYRGLVIDADTKAPLAGAVVVAAWTRDRIYPFHSVNERYAVREVLTDSEGRFLIDAGDVEEHAPRRTLRPEFIIFLPNYGSFPSLQRKPIGFLGDVFEGAGTTIELPRLDGQQARRTHLRAISPQSFSERPFKDLPQLMQRINEERVAIGLTPHAPSETP